MLIVFYCIILLGDGIINKLIDYLNSFDIEYEIRSYNPNGVSAKEAALEMNVSIDNMLKTLLIKNNDEYMLALIPITKMITNPKYKLVDRNCIEDITGYLLVV